MVAQAIARADAASRLTKFLSIFASQPVELIIVTLTCYFYDFDTAEDTDSALILAQ
jgi:hypothetical protein